MEKSKKIKVGYTFETECTDSDYQAKIILLFWRVITLKKV